LPPTRERPTDGLRDAPRHGFERCPLRMTWKPPETVVTVRDDVPPIVSIHITPERDILAFPAASVDEDGAVCRKWCRVDVQSEAVNDAEPAVVCTECLFVRRELEVVSEDEAEVVRVW